MSSSNVLGNSNSQPQPPSDPAPASGRGILHRLWQAFWLTFLVVSLAYAWYCFYVPSNSVVWAENYAAAQQQAVQSDKPIILFFTGDWCVPCRIMKRNVWADDEVAATVNAKFVPVMLDVNDPGAVDALKRYSVGSTPKTVVADKDGNVLRQRDGGITKSEFLDLLHLENGSGTEGL
ncbi:thiol:disulfide interchange protein precursor [Roseimaritima multifibrata]|uniref:Thiol:disulfide interchange protein n=1 Tax=Roseimaritima multifibrata TaxID=1930274 RepID=A0A517MGQ2_9BACT|nr:thioredoxin family protein [Roseimaritima multifibrata]QDS94046.1 thiol:disulfide interchange protein precursor [Roseimaritima multifibrata]